MPPFAAARAHAGCFAARTDCRTTHWHAGLRLAALREHAERVLQLERHDAGGEADGCPQAHAAAVPQEAHPLHAHQGDARNAADTENGAAGACRKGNELPQRVVSLNLREHLDGGLDQGHVVHDRGGDTQQGADGQAAAAAELREELRVALQHAGAVQRHDRQQHAGEEEQAGEVHLVQGLGHAGLQCPGVARLSGRLPPVPGLGALLGGLDVKIRQPPGARGPGRGGVAGACVALGNDAQGVRGDPHDAQGQEHAQVRRQARPDLQDWHHEDAADAQGQHPDVRSGDLRGPGADGLLGSADVARARGGLLRLGGRVPPCLPPKARQWNDACHQGRKEQAGNGLQGRDLALDPEHRGGHVADRAPSAAGVCCDHRAAATAEAEGLVVSGHVAEKLQRHNRRRKVVDDRAEEEGQETDDGHQPLYVAGHHPPDNGRHYCEATEVVNGLHNTHGRQEKQDDAADFLQAPVKFVVKLSRPNLGFDRVVAHSKVRPHGAGQDQHHGRLVDAHNVLQCHSGQPGGKES
mmetsp:Transcript_21115/g.66780  ORF Transcript_21115/g.66780 Transcript_21115/m.66780 type:complete len:523 (-) Transcript_21115:588-2156(-)